ncbi:uncharacterized protein [Acropora muricata]|uniref:uncharacterized protein n=1 Tax=Acropora muricata TaxID=159855 RepID=UPI0034E5F6E3
MVKLCRFTTFRNRSRRCKLNKVQKMSQRCASLLLFLCFSVAATLSSARNSSTDPLLQTTSSTLLLSSVTSSASSPVVNSSSAMVVNPTSTQLTPSQTPSVPISKPDPTTAKPLSTARPTGSKGRTLGPLEIVGFCLVGVIVTLVCLFAIYYFFFRMKWYPEYWTKLEAEAASSKTEAVPGKVTIVTAGAPDKKVPEIGVTHHGFVGDSSEKKVPPVHYQGTEAKNGVANGSATEGQSADNGGFSEDSAL